MQTVTQTPSFAPMPLPQERGIDASKIKLYAPLPLPTERKIDPATIKRYAPFPPVPQNPRPRSTAQIVQSQATLAQLKSSLNPRDEDMQRRVLETQNMLAQQRQARDIQRVKIDRGLS